MTPGIHRRHFLYVTGTAATVGLAGCLGDDEEGSMEQEGSGAGSGSGDGDLEFAAEILEPTNNNELDRVELGESDKGYSGRETIGVGVFNTTGEDDDVFPSEETEYELTLENGDDPITVAEGKLEFGEIDEIGLDYKQIVRTLDTGVERNETHQLAGNHTLTLKTKNGEKTQQKNIDLKLNEPNFFGTLYTEEDNTEAIKERLAMIPPDTIGLNGTKVYDTKIMRNTASEEAYHEYREGPGGDRALPWDRTKDRSDQLLSDDLDIVIRNGNFIILGYDEDADTELAEENFFSKLKERQEKEDIGDEELDEVEGRTVYRVNRVNYRVFDNEENEGIMTSNPAISDLTHEEVLTGLLRTLDADPEDYDEPVSVVDPGAEEELDRFAQWMRSEEFLDEHYIVGISGTSVYGSDLDPGAVTESTFEVRTYNPEKDIYEDRLYGIKETNDGYEFELGVVDEREDIDKVVADF